MNPQQNQLINRGTFVKILAEPLCVGHGGSSIPPSPRHIGKICLVILTNNRPKIYTPWNSLLADDNGDTFWIDHHYLEVV